LDTPPFFIGGKEGLNEKLNELMSYPTQALRMQIEGKVIAEFFINEDSSISDVLITRGIGAGCDEELWKALKKINEGWVTGEKDNKKLKCKVTLTVQYKLNSNATTSIILM
jgi:periplasmic protein TonB